MAALSIRQISALEQTDPNVVGEFRTFVDKYFQQHDQ